MAVQLCMDLVRSLSAVQTVDCTTLHRLLLAPQGMKGFDLNELETLFKDIISAYRWITDSSSSSIVSLSVRRDEVLKSEDVDELLECLQIYHNLGKFIHKKIVSVTSVRLPHQGEEDKQDQHVDIEVICPTPDEVSRNDDHEEEIEQRSCELVERLIGRQVGFDVKKETFLDPEDVRLLERGNPGPEPKTAAAPEPSMEVKKTVKHARTSFRTLEYPCRHCPFVADRYAVLQVSRKW